MLSAGGNLLPRLASDDDLIRLALGKECIVAQLSLRIVAPAPQGLVGLNAAGV
jgi:hypothetical protein